MLIVCPNCQSSYRVATDSLGAVGRTVRCAKCNTAWFAELSEDDGKATENAPLMVTESAGEDKDNLYGSADPAMTRLANVMATIREDQQRSTREAALAAEVKSSTSRRRMVPAFAVVMVLVAVLGGLAAGREAVVRTFPQTAQLYAMVGLPVNLRGLAFRSIEASERVEGGVPILLVSGTVENVTRGVINVPRLRLSVRNTDGREIYVWTVVPRRSRLVAGDTLSFQAQLASPPAEARDISVRFLAHQDAVAGLR